MSPDDFLADLNAYFACTAGSVIKHDGQVLNLIGDAVLAIFPTGEHFATDEEVCAAAVAAAREADAGLKVLNETRRVPLRCGIALHFGEVIYGNIGTSERVQFTAVGRAVNQVARLEALTKELDRPILASEKFSGCQGATWDRLGDYELRGIGPTTVYAPRFA